MKIWSIVKLVFLSLVALIALTLLTVEPPKKTQNKTIDIKNLPKTVELIGFENQKFTTNSIIKKGNIIFVGNQQSIRIANKLEQRLKLKAGKFVIVSNISDAPWFIKRWQAHTQNVKLKGEKHLPWIYDRDGSFRNFLKVPTSDAVKYFVYKVEDTGIVNRIYVGKVKTETTNKEKIKENLDEVVKVIKEN